MTDNPIDKLERNARRAMTARSEVTTGVSRIYLADLPDVMAGALLFIRDYLGGCLFVSTASEWSPVNRLPNVLYANLPSSADEGVTAFVTNGRKVGEAAGAGTGVPVYFSNGAWRVYSTDQAVTI